MKQKLNVACLISVVVFFAGTSDQAIGQVLVSHQTATSYEPSQTLRVTNSFTYTGNLLSLLWRPVLPAGWTLVPGGVSGTSGTPELQYGEIVWVGALPASLVEMVYTVQVPAGVTGMQSIRGEVEYQFLGMANADLTTASPNPLVIQAAGVCQYGLSASAWEVPASGGSTSISVTASGSNCSWQVAGECDWVTVVPSGGTGSGSINLSAAVNATGSSRNCTLTVGGQALVLTQLPQPSGPAVTHRSAASYENGQTLRVTNTFSYTGNLLSLLWRPVLPGGWTLVPGGVSGSNGTPELQYGEIVWVGLLPASPAEMVYTVQVPAGATGAQSIRGEVEYLFLGMANAVLTTASPNPLVIQSAVVCQYGLSASAWEVQASGGSTSISVTASASSCTWQVAGVCNWLTVVPSEGMGNGSVNLAVGANVTGTGRSCTLTIGGQTLVVDQDPVELPPKFVSGDFSGDGRGDIIWEHESGSRTFWFNLQSPNISWQYLRERNAAPGWRLVAGADMNWDGSQDLVWEATNGWRAVWFMQGPTQTAVRAFIPGLTDPAWQIVGAGDFNQDGNSDIVWEHSNGKHRVTYMEVNRVVSDAFILDANGRDDQPGPGWHVAAIGDLNGDNRPDLVWENLALGYRTAWLMNNNRAVSGWYGWTKSLPPGKGQWSIAGLGDLNGDRNPDLVFQSDQGWQWIWYLDGGRRVIGEGDIDLTPNAPMPNDWRIALLTDLNKDGLADVIWEHVGGDHTVWYRVAQANIPWSYLKPSNYDPKWEIAARGDMNGDDQTDLIWQSPEGFRAVWFMNQMRKASDTPLQIAWADPSWRIVEAVDFDGDDWPDLLWENDERRYRIGYMEGILETRQGYLQSSAANPGSEGLLMDPKWRITAAGDMNLDGKPDLVWSHEDGIHSTWLLTNDVVGRSLDFRPQSWGYLHKGRWPGWVPCGLSDLYGDGLLDLIWESADGQHTIWFLEGAKTFQYDVNGVIKPPPWGYLHSDQMDPKWRIAIP
ncbi:MAG TPA: BACON domain-containing carbohydrate-binding protein [Verrucomicrobiota bacterium]|nr:BACON domain-containing carbohydrate-binding protein [Verrucomicrobiota bacterium]